MLLLCVLCPCTCCGVSTPVCELEADGAVVRSVEFALEELPRVYADDTLREELDALVEVVEPVAEFVIEPVVVVACAAMDGAGVAVIVSVVVGMGERDRVGDTEGERNGERGGDEPMESVSEPLGAGVCIGDAVVGGARDCA